MKSRFVSRSHSLRRGSVAVLIAACLVVLVGIVAIAFDGGLMIDERRHAQATADAAALAAATDLYNNFYDNQGVDSFGTARASALANAAGNGYTNNTTDSIVTVRLAGETPVQSSPAPITDAAGRLAPGYVEVNVEFKQRRAFSAMIGSGDIPIRARAVAEGRITPRVRPGVILLEPTQEFPLKVDGNGVLTAEDASVNINSSNPASFQHTGSGPVSALEWYYNSDPGYVSSGSGTITGDQFTNVPPTPDPLRNLPVPDPSTMTVQSNHKLNINGGGTKVLSPGVYKGGISFSGNGNYDITLLPGIYYIDDGGFSITGNGTVVAEGVMIYNTSGSNNSNPADNFSISGNGSVTLSPPTTGIYAGMSLFQDRKLNLDIAITGNGNTDVTGTVYAANSMVNVVGNGAAGVTDYLGSQFITRWMQISGESNIDIGIKPGTPNPLMRTVQLVE